VSHIPQINAFYLQKEAELKLRMETLLSKRRAAAMRGLPDNTGDATQNHVEWSAVEEGFRLLERDLGKLQVSARAAPLPDSRTNISFTAIC
jgi:CDK inhibitor PHO81